MCLVQQLVCLSWQTDRDATISPDSDGCLGSSGSSLDMLDALVSDNTTSAVADG